MPKKTTKLSELLSEIDKDQLCDILLNLAESSLEIDSRIRTLITPKSQLNNPISFYKKSLKKLPTKVKNSSDRKLLVEALGPVLTQVKDLQSRNNYSEANKPLFVILETVLFKLAKSDLKAMLGEMQKAAVSWSENIDKVPNSELQFVSLQEVLDLENSKELRLENRLMGYGISGGGFTPVYSNSGLHADFYQLLLQLSKSIESKSLLEDLRTYLTNHKKSKEFSLQLLNISQKLDSEESFLKSANKNLRDRDNAVLIKEYYWKQGEYQKATNILFQHIELHQNYFSFKNSEEYTSAVEYVNIFEQNPQYCQLEDYCKVLVCLVATGDCNTAQDISSSAKWRKYFDDLVSAAGMDLQQYYNLIVGLLAKKYLSKILASLALLVGDKALLAKYVGSLEYWDDIVFASETIVKDYPEQAFVSIAKLIRNNLSEYDYSSYSDEEDFRAMFEQHRILKLLNDIRAGVAEVSHKKIDSMVIKVNKCYGLFGK